MGGSVLALGVDVPPAVEAAFEALVGVVLVALGVRALLGSPSVGRAALHGVGLGGSDRDVGGDSDRDGSAERRGDREPGAGHGHLRVLGHEVAPAHVHADRESFGVGVVHGFAGSGGVFVALAATAASPVDGAAFLGGFAVATVGSMAAASWGLDRAAGYADAVRLFGGAASVLVGLLVLAESAGVATGL
ncbi:hypothetical protein BRC97_03245 [Halobacteriales archaeon QS_6_71_20]|nr:MAG: hypothetical protein BRC97_03245 [Halobacteriales archaeon QS_6_71_20]